MQCWQSLQNINKNKPAETRKGGRKKRDEELIKVTG